MVVVVVVVVVVEVVVVVVVAAQALYSGLGIASDSVEPRSGKCAGTFPPKPKPASLKPRRTHPKYSSQEGLGFRVDSQC